MTALARLLIPVGCLLASVLAHADCNADFSQRVLTTQHRLDALHPDKPGQLRVVSADGAVVSAGQVHWMRGQIQAVAGACHRADQTAAASALAGVDQLLRPR